MPRSLKNCHNVLDLRDLAKRRLPGPIFHYIDGAAEDEITYRRNTSAFDDYDLVPNVLAGVENIDMSVEVMGFKLGLPIFCSPTALQRLFHHEGERGVALAAEKYNTLFGVSSLTTVSLEEIGRMISTPKMFQFYFHKDRGLNASMVEAAKAAKFDILTLTVDTITGGNRERDLRTGFTSPPRLTPKSLIEFASKPVWGLNYLFRGKFELAQLKDHMREGTNIAISVGDYFSSMLDQSMTWDDVADLQRSWGGKFCLKGIMSADDARRAVEIGADAIMISNHGGAATRWWSESFRSVRGNSAGCGRKDRYNFGRRNTKGDSYFKGNCSWCNSLFRWADVPLCARRSRKTWSGKCFGKSSR